MHIRIKHCAGTSGMRDGNLRIDHGSRLLGLKGGPCDVACKRMDFIVM